MEFGNQDETKHRGAKKSNDVREGTNRRKNANITLRKNKRDELLNSKRRMGDDVTTQSSSRGTGVAERSHAASTPFDGVDARDLDPFAYDQFTMPYLVPPQLLPAFVEMINSDDPQLHMHGTLMIRKLLSVDNDAPVDRVIEMGCVEVFVQQLLRDEMPQLQFESAWALTNIASGAMEHTHYVIGANDAVANFVRLLDSPNEDCREQAAWAIGNLAGEGAKCRDFVLEHGALRPILRLVTSPADKQSTLRNAAWALSNLCRGKPQPKHEAIAEALPVIVDMLNHSDDELIVDAAWAISYLSDGTNDRIQRILETGCLPRIIELLSANTSAMITPAIRAIGNIVTGNDRQTQAVINGGALEPMHFLLNHPKRSIRKETCWSLSNITAGNKDQINCIINANLFPALLHATTCSEFDVKKEATWAVANATSGGSAEQVNYLVEIGTLDYMCDLLTVYDVKIVSIALEAIDNILDVGERLRQQNNTEFNSYADLIIERGHYEKLQALQNHSNTDIFNHINVVLEAYFNLEDGDGPAAGMGAGEEEYGDDGFNMRRDGFHNQSSNYDF